MLEAASTPISKKEMPIYISPEDAQAIVAICGSRADVMVKGKPYSAQLREEMIQVGCTKAIEVYPDWDPKRATLDAFLYRHVTGAMLDFLRKERKHWFKTNSETVRSRAEKLNPKTLSPSAAWITGGVPSATPDKILSRQEAVEIIQGALSQLSIEHPKEAAVIRKHYWEDKTLKQSGQEVDVNESRARQLIGGYKDKRRDVFIPGAVSHLREILEEQGYDPTYLLGLLEK